VPSIFDLPAIPPLIWIRNANSHLIIDTTGRARHRITVTLSIGSNSGDTSISAECGVTFLAIALGSCVRSFPDCAIVRGLLTAMALSFLNRVRVWSLTPSVAASGAMLFILALFISNVEAWRPAAFFGRYQDVAIYFSAAQALAKL